jgi:hypothetical protein
MRIYGRITTILTLAIAVLFMAACGTSTTTGSSSQTPAQLLQKSFSAMQSLKSAHFTLQMNDTVNTSGASTSSTGSSAPRQITIQLSGSGDEVPPQKESSATVTFNLGQLGTQTGVQNMKLSEIVTGGKLYLKNSKGQWYVLNSSQLSSSPLGGSDATNYNKLLQIAQKAQITDHGDENLNGQSLRHLTATFGKDVLKDLLDATGAAGSLNNGSSASQQNMNSIINMIQVQKATMDGWFDESTGYLHRLDIKLGLNINPSATPTTSSSAASGNVTTNIDTTIDYSNFNQPITITAPSNAIPTSSMVGIFQQ